MWDVVPNSFLPRQFTRNHYRYCRSHPGGGQMWLASIMADLRGISKTATTTRHSLLGRSGLFSWPLISVANDDATTATASCTIYGLRLNMVLRNVAVNTSHWILGCLILSQASSSGNTGGNVISYSAAISASGQAADWRAAVGLLLSMQIALVETTVITYNALVSSLATPNQPRWRWVLMYLEDMQVKRIATDIITFNAAMSACENEEWELALALLSCLKEKRLQANIISFNTCISTCSQWETAEVLLHGLKEHDGSRDVVSLNATITACANAALWQRICGLLCRGIECDVITYNAAIRAQRGDQWTLALALMTMREPSVVSFNASISACETASEWRAATQLLQDLEEREMRPDVVTASSIVTAAAAGSWRLAAFAFYQGRGSVQSLGALLRVWRSWPRSLHLLEAQMFVDITIYEAVVLTACDQGATLPCLQMLGPLQRAAVPLLKVGIDQGDPCGKQLIGQR
eukprot:symbB.v1.2.003382.t1/scaffold190.1/size276550/7